MPISFECSLVYLRTNQHHSCIWLLSIPIIIKLYIKADFVHKLTFKRYTQSLELVIIFEAVRIPQVGF